MSSRLENLTTDDIFLACNAFDHKNWPLATKRDALLQYGTGDVRVVFRHYQTILTNAGCNLVNALSQWTDLKLHVDSNARYNNQHPLLVWQLVSQMDQDKGDYRDTRVIFYVRRIRLYLYNYRIYGTISIYILKGLAFVYQLI